MIEPSEDSLMSPFFLFILIQTVLLIKGKTSYEFLKSRVYKNSGTKRLATLMSLSYNRHETLESSACQGSFYV